MKGDKNELSTHFFRSRQRRKKRRQKKHRWPQETIEITPSLNDDLMAKIKPMTAQAGGCKEFGSQVLDVSENKIIIHAVCSSCRRLLIEQITDSLGKKITIQVD
ncbi:hypothetical protein AMJ47_02920 [Parcubacteria bacterium DG_72]|nr:MAG: hypothetical protein AMJ47_02920 [Parcubacteria bacterium DG_72]